MKRDARVHSFWRSRWTPDDGAIVECREALAFPGHPDRCVLLPRVQVLEGAARLSVQLDLRPRFGRASLRWRLGISLPLVREMERSGLESLRRRFAIEGDTAA
jgi:hypothetical protein